MGCFISLVSLSCFFFPFLKTKLEDRVLLKSGAWGAGVEWAQIVQLTCTVSEPSQQNWEIYFQKFFLSLFVPESDFITFICIMRY